MAYTVHQAKTHFSRLLKEAEAGQEVVVMRGSKPVAKIVPIAGDIRARVAELLQIKPGDVGIKAKTPEGTGTENAAIAHAVVLLESIPLEPFLEEDAVAVSVRDDDEVSDLIDGNGNGRH